jgi:drug/metabolite transporter (DMT)-like permease
VLASLLALAAAPGYGASDFLAGLKARTISTVVVAAVSQGAGLLFAAAIVAARGRPPPGPEFVVYALLTGVAAAVGLTSLYRALAMGPMGIVSPIAATSLVVPVAVAVLAGERPSARQSIGILACIVGVVLVSRARGASGRPASRAAIGLGLLAALALGGVVVGFDASSEGDPYWAVAVARAAAVALLAGALLFTGGDVRGIGRRDLSVLALVGVLNDAANVLFAVASTLGLLAIVSVLSALYPVVTAALARVVLHERLSAWQLIGAGLALLGVLLITIA